MSEASLIYIIEDEIALADVLAAYLEKAGYRTRRFASGEGVVEAVRAEAPACLLLDLMLPVKDGLSICREVRQFSLVPILMVTARVEEIDRLLGLELGADDYICKPYSPREVVARVRAVLRRLDPAFRSILAAANARLILDEAAFQARLDGQILGLTPAEFRLLAVFASQPGRVFSRQQLMDRLYDDHRIVTDRTVDSHIKNLRRKLRDAAPDTELIQAIYGVGYKLEWPVD